MISSIELLALLPSAPITHLIAQLADPGIDTPEEAALVFSGPQFFIAVLSGLVLAFGFQLLLTNLSVATGISYVGRSHSSSSSSSSSSGGMGIRKISAAFGLWTLITVSLALFFACLLAVKLSLYNSSLLGAITGLVIWGTYFSLLLWVSSTTVGSLIGSVVRSATSSFQTLMGSATAALGARAASNQIIETAEATVAAVRRELMSGVDPSDFKETLRDYLSGIRSPELNADDVSQEFERMLRESDVLASASDDIINQIDRDTFRRLVSNRTDLSPRETDRIADRLYRSWRSALGRQNKSGVTDLVDYLRTAHPEEVISERLDRRLQEFLDEYRKHNNATSQPAAGSQGGGGNPLAQGMNTLLGVLMGRADLSDLDLQKITDRLKSAQSEVTKQVDNLRSQTSGSSDYSVVKADVENYLYTTYPWQLQSERLETEFREVIYDTQASPESLIRELQKLNRTYFAELLSSRGLMTPDEVRQTADTLERVRQRVLTEVVDVYRLEAAKELQERTDTFLQLTPREELVSDVGSRAFRSILEDPSASVEELRDRFSPFSQDFLFVTLSRRPDLTELEARQIAQQLDQVRAQVLADHQGAYQAAKTQLDNQWTGLQNYLRNTGKAELNPESIKAELQTLLRDPSAGAHQLQNRASHFDRDTLVQLLSQRPDVSEYEANHIVDQVESTWYSIVHAPANLSAGARSNYENATHVIADYLRRTGKPELNPAGIQRDLQMLLSNPKVGARAMRERLSQMDRDTLVQLLSQREDLSEADVNRIIDDVQESIHKVLRAPQRLARRTQSKVMSFERALEEYLRNTNKTELNPDGIKRDLQLLLQDPRLGSQQLQNRLSQIDRSTLVALLSQRKDMSQEEAESLINQVLSVRDQMMSQIRGVQDQIQGAIAGILAKIRDYLNSLERPELNYNGIRQDLRKLFDDPQAGLDALRGRLSQFDRGTLVALLSSHNAISEADANRLIDQIEDVRDSAIRKAERIEQQVESRIRDLKMQAQHQVEETRKTAEAAAWWLFGTATVSAIVSAIAGGLAAAG
ncbi:MFS transporter [Leptolyngbya sp. FACHB-16]|uniref:MFS transporter n=1 Tax=unclassified Leptolyngbya TaxID=2650499 RepID=UPI001688594E|nr:MFS transporter [Leptolyngbya sp. FACHB-16]MBD2157406.1 MFS transporter [Leptolyngbya sp. FACHB-16]